MLKQPKRTSTFDNLGNISENQTDDLKLAALFTVSDDGTIEKSKVGIFLLNPNSIEESKSSNWVQHNTPGQSDPILQWMGGGPRTIRFTALVTADTSDFVSQGQKPGESPQENSENSNKIFTGFIASAFAKTTAPPPKRTSSSELPGTNLDISNYLNYYRSLLYPVYDNFQNPKKLKFNPPLLVFFSGSAVNKYKFGDKISNQHDVWVLTNIKIKITKQLPNLSPMEAEVDFELTQYNIKSFSRDRFLTPGN